MDKNNYISGAHVKNADFEKIFFISFHKDITEYIRKAKSKRNNIIFSILLIIAGIAVFFLVYDGNIKLFGIAVAALGLVLNVINLVSYKKVSVESSLSKIGNISIPFKKYRIGEKYFLLDMSLMSGEIEFKYFGLQEKQQLSLSLLNSSLINLIKKYPIVISEKSKESVLIGKGHGSIDLYTEEKEVTDNAQKVRTQVEEAIEYKANLPVIESDYKFINYLVKIKESYPDKKSYFFENLDSQKAKAKIEHMGGIIEIGRGNKDSRDIEHTCKSLLDMYNRILPRYIYTLNAALTDFPYNNYLKRLDTYSITNIYYCPYCNFAELERIKSNDYFHTKNGVSHKKVKLRKNTELKLIDRTQFLWKCSVCGKETNEPIIRNKMDEELFTPVYDNLSEEHFKERLKIYNEINDQKRSYSEKASTQFHQVVRENRNKEDRIKGQIRGLSTEILSEQTAIQRLNDMLLKYDRIDKKRAQQIETDINQIKQKVDEENQKAKEEIKQTVLDAQIKIEKITKKYDSLERKDQLKRDLVQKQINQHTGKIAKETRQIKHNTKRAALYSGITAINTTKINHKMK